MVHLKKKKKDNSFFITNGSAHSNPRNRFDHFNFLKNFFRKHFPQTPTNSISPYFLSYFYYFM